MVSSAFRIFTCCTYFCPLYVFSTNHHSVENLRKSHDFQLFQQSFQHFQRDFDVENVDLPYSGCKNQQVHSNGLEYANQVKGDVSKVIKGVNKQIVEIKCTNNEYFERVLLFVNSRSNRFSEVSADALARQYIAELTDEFSENEEPKSASRGQYIRLLSAAAFAVLVAAVFVGAVVIRR